MKKILKYIITFIILLVIYNISLYLACCFPSENIKENVLESTKIISKEGNIFSVTEDRSVIVDNNTDALMINESYSIDNEDTIFSYMSARKNYKKGLTKEEKEDTKGEFVYYPPENKVIENPVEELKFFVNDELTVSVEYARYWHGYLSVLRPALLLFNINQIRNLLSIVMIALLGGMLYLLRKNYGNIIMAIFMISLLCVDFLYIHNSLQQTPVFIVMLISSIILLLKKTRRKNFSLFLFIVGSITNFVDYLTVPLITMAIPIYIILIDLYKDKKLEKMNIKEILKELFKWIIAWGIGYGLTWFAKWFLYDLLYNKNLIQTSINQVFYRTSNDHALTIYTVKHAMIKMLANYIPIIAVFAILNISHKLDNKNSFKLEKNNIKTLILPILIIAIIPIIVLLIMANHTAFHYIFTYRNFMIVILGILLSCEFIFERKQ